MPRATPAGLSERLGLGKGTAQSPAPGPERGGTGRESPATQEGGGVAFPCSCALAGRQRVAFGEPDFPEGYYQYKYVVRFHNGSIRWVGDPCTKYGGTQQNNSAFVKGGHSLPVQPLARRLPWQDLVIYELMTDDFTKGYR